MRSSVILLLAWGSHVEDIPVVSSEPLGRIAGEGVKAIFIAIVTVISSPSHNSPCTGAPIMMQSDAPWTLCLNVSGNKPLETRWAQQIEARKNEVEG